MELVITVINHECQLVVIIISLISWQYQIGQRARKTTHSGPRMRQSEREDKLSQAINKV